MSFGPTGRPLGVREVPELRRNPASAKVAAMVAADPDAVPEVSPDEFTKYFRLARSIRGSDPPGMGRRCMALMDLQDPRLWCTDGGACTDAVVAAAAVARCSFSKGFDVDDLVTRAMASPRPPLERLDEPGFTEPMLLCNKCGAWWKESESEAHRPGC